MTGAAIRRVAWTAFGCLWMGSIVVGMAVLMDYSSQPGIAAAAPTAWPADTRLTRDPDRPTLVMLAHPRCDCSKASVSELAELLARARHRPRVYVVFVKPGGAAAEWEQTSLWKSAAAIPGVTVLRDDLGVEARRFHVQTSGQVLLYDAHGALIYAGGTTAARGKTGDNFGRAAILAALDEGHPHSPSSPVYGCSLFGPADQAAAPETDHTDHDHASQKR
jgi:hypothetical protein